MKIKMERKMNTTHTNTHTHLFLIYCEEKFALTGYEEDSGLLSLGQRLSVNGP